MIHHVSISAREPKRVANVLAELMKGRVYRFPGRVANAFMALSGDEHGSMIEVFPEHTALRPGDDDLQVCPTSLASPKYTPFHLLLSVPVDGATAVSIGAREGWRAGRFGRGSPGRPPAFHVIEFWLENRLLVELTTQDMLADYIRRVRFDMLDVELLAEPNEGHYPARNLVNSEQSRLPSHTAASPRFPYSVSDAFGECCLAVSASNRLTGGWH